MVLLDNEQSESLTLIGWEALLSMALRGRIQLPIKPKCYILSTVMSVTTLPSILPVKLKIYKSTKCFANYTDFQLQNYGWGAVPVVGGCVTIVTVQQKEYLICGAYHPNAAR